MKKIELTVRLHDAADAQNDVFDNYVKDLLTEAAHELEEAIGLLCLFDDPHAEKFVMRHSTPLEPFTQGKLHAFITGETVTRQND